MSEKIDHLAAFLRDARIPGQLLYAKVWGSHSHNTNLPTSDIDFGAVYQLPTSAVLGLQPKPETTDGTNPDFQAHEVAKFARLLLKGNPAILETLFTERYQYMTPAWLNLRAERKRFLSRRAVSQYLGYAHSQLHKLKHKVYLHTAGGGYNTKWAYHLVRLLRDGFRIAQGGEPVIWKEGEEREELMAIRRGEVKEADATELAESLLKQADAALAISTLPAEGDGKWLEDWLLDLRLTEWGRLPRGKERGRLAAL